MLYKELAELYESLGSTTKRLEKTDILSKFLKELSEKDRDVMYLLLGNIYPEYDERRIGISNQLAIKAISKATGTEPKQVVHEPHSRFAPSSIWMGQWLCIDPSWEYTARQTL